MYLVKVVAVVLALSFALVAPEKATHWGIAFERERAGLVCKEIDIPGGLHYVYLEGGQGKPLMLLHGFGGNKDNFTRVARFLTPHYHVIVPDQIGFGESSHPQEDADYSSTAQARHLHALVHALGVDDLDVGGNSMGGQIALDYAALYPKEVKSLWLLDPGGIWSAPESEARRIYRETGKTVLLDANEDDFARTFAFVMSDPPYVPRYMLNVMAQERIHNYDLEKRILKVIAAESVEQRVKGLATPSLIVWGANDRVIHVATADILHKLMPNSQVIIMPGVGHVPMLERPEQSAQDYLNFRSSLQPAVVSAHE